MIDYSTILDEDWLEEIEIVEDFAENNENLYLPTNYYKFNDAFYYNDFLGTEIESLFLDLDNENYIFRIAQSVPIGDYGTRWVFAWFKSTKEGTEKIKKSLRESNINIEMKGNDK